MARRPAAPRMPAALRQALRALARAPGFALAALATFALGIGANAAVFGGVDAVLLVVGSKGARRSAVRDAAAQLALASSSPVAALFSR